VALKHAILSALSRGVPLNGYALNNVFSNETERSWHASTSQVYSELLKMERSGLIQVSERNELGHTSYEITPEGTAEIKHWLQLTDPDHTVRDDSLLRLMTLWVVDDVSARHLAEAELSFQRKRQSLLKQKITEFTETREDNRVWRNRRAIYELWLAQTNSMVQWLERLPEIFERPDDDLAEILNEARLLEGASDFPARTATAV
jgi:DNA-binding PadR family transcriptional regulator